MRTFVFLVISAALMLASPSVCAAPSSAVSILQAYRAASGGNAWVGKATLKTESVVAGAGMTGTDISVTDLRDGRNVDHSTLGPIKTAQGFDGNEPWRQEPSGTVNIEAGGDAPVLAINQAYRSANLWWRPDLGDAKVTHSGTKPCGGSHCNVLTITPKGGKSFDAWFDTKTHLLSRILEERGGRTWTTTLSDYVPVDGVQLPHKTVIDAGVGPKYVFIQTLTKAQFLAAEPDTTYAPPRVKVTDFFSIAGGATRTTFPFHLFNNHIYANAWVNGHGPLLFIFDTGGQNILIPSTAKALGIKTEGALPSSGAGNKAQNYGLAKVATLRVGGVTFHNQVVGALDFIPNSVEGVEIKGMVGFGVFKRFVTRIDYGKHTITLIEPEHFNPADAGTPIKFVFNGHLPEVDGVFEGIPGKFTVDTGARNDLTLNGPFWRQHDLRTKHPKGLLAVDGWGVGGAAQSYVTRGAELTIGPVKIPDVVTSLSLQKKGFFAAASSQGNIGAGVLKRFVVTFDYTNHTMYLKPLPGPVADAGTFDRSGMWINAAKDGVEVMSVTAKGPAQAAGIKVGDIITAVDGKPTPSIPLYELRRQLRDEAPGTVVTFTVKRGNVTHKVPVVLRDQI